jgi:hypothetical protein
MGHPGRPSQCHLIPCSEGVLDHNIQVGKSTAKPSHKGHELCWPTNLAAIFKLADSDGIGSQQIVNRLGPALVPYFSEPTPH